jgi:serine/threonine protein kinase
MELTVQNVYGLLLRSRLMSLDEAKAMYARWQEEAKETATNLARFAAWMVGHKYVTEYQASLLARGHADGFFLNQYKILDRLGKGRMAGVYKAQHPTGQIVAIKVLPPSKAREPSYLRRFHREVRLALKLKHPNIVRSFQTGKAEELHYLVMEFLEGETLEEVLQRNKRIPLTDAVRLISQALQGLQHIHEQGLVHRDLKPANLMLVGATSDSTARATVKILDIGLGRALFDESSVDQVSDSLEKNADLTGEGVLLGTPDYMSPEQARDPRTTDIRGDIYSLGCVLYHLLAGQPPFPDSNIISQMIRHATEPPRPLKSLNSNVPDGLQQIMSWMIAKDPNARYPTPERAAKALQVLLVAGTEGPPSPEGDPQMRSFLTWLEGQEKTVVPLTPSPAAPAAAVPGGVPMAPKLSPDALAPAQKLPPPKPAKASRAEKRRAASEKRRKKHRHAHPPALAAPVADASSFPVLDPVSSINVELVPAAPLHSSPAAGGGLKLSRRDLVLFGIGAATGAAATFAGCLLALSTRKEKPASPPEDPNSKDP